jgi:hypothetical protein
MLIMYCKSVQQRCVGGGQVHAEERSPIHSTDKITVPVAILQVRGVSRFVILVYGAVHPVCGCSRKCGSSSCIERSPIHSAGRITIVVAILQVQGVSLGPPTHPPTHPYN